MSFDILPDSRLKAPKHVALHQGRNWQPIFCANCGADGGMVPEDNMTFAFYLCQTCGEKWSELSGVYLMPDQVFWQKVHDAQMNEYGRLLNADEIAVELSKPASVLSKLKKENP